MTPRTFAARAITLMLFAMSVESCGTLPSETNRRKPVAITFSRAEAINAFPGAYVSVLDTGGGIAEADLDRIFEVAFQGDRARTPGGGAGLGLAIAKGFVDAHQGELTVCNENGGARFTLRLPRERVEHGE